MVADTDTDPDDGSVGGARFSVVVQRAARIANWLAPEDGGPRTLSPAGTVRKPEVPEACAAVGIPVPGKYRSAADVRDLNLPWAFAVGSGLIDISGKKTASKSGLDLEALDGEEFGRRWLAGTRAVLDAETPKDADEGVRILVLTALAVLDRAASGQPDLAGGDAFWRAVRATSDRVGDMFNVSHGSLWPARRKYYDGPRFTSMPGLATLLTALGLADGGVDDLTITDLGRWALHRLDEGLAAAADQELPAREMIAEAAEFHGEETRLHVASAWLAARKPGTAVRELLTAAAGMSARERAIAVELALAAGEAALGEWRKMASNPRIGPHAAMVLWEYGKRGEPSDANRRWLAVEAASIAVAGENPDEALTLVSEALPGDDAESWLAGVDKTGHPDAKEVTEAVTSFLASGAPRVIDSVLQLKVTLTGYRPATWRRVQMPATADLEDLHDVIQTLFGWGGDHLYVFTVGKRHYSGVFGHLDDTGYDHEIRLNTAFAPGAKGKGKKIEYVYDLGASWKHEITLEKTLPASPGQQYPVCVEFAGGYPVEYPPESYEDGDGEPEPFDLAEANRNLR